MTQYLPKYSHVMVHLVDGDDNRLDASNICTVVVDGKEYELDDDIPVTPESKIMFKIKEPPIWELPEKHGFRITFR